jgi:hypothetical protein
MSNTRLSRRAFTARLLTAGLLTTGLLFPGGQAQAQITLGPPPTKFPPLILAGDYYYSAIILRRPGFWQQGVANAIGKYYGNSAVAGSVWDSTSPLDKRAAKFETRLMLHPSGFVRSEVFATTGYNGYLKHAGVAFVDDMNGENQRAFLWNDSNQSFVNLHPAGFSHSIAYGAAGLRQVGAAAQNGRYMAACWDGTAASYTNLHPASGFRHSEIRGTDGGFHAGAGWPSGTINVFTGLPEGRSHALLWGSNGSIIDLHPAGPVPSLTTPRTFDSTAATALDNGQQVGYGSDSTNTHALIWDSTNTTARDLHPADSGYTDSYALGLAYNVAAGVGYYMGRFHALAWHGVRAENLFDLHHVLPSGYEESGAHGVGIYGDIVGWASPTTTVGNGDRDRVPVRWMYRRKVTKPPFEFGPREESFPANRRRGEGFIITEVRMPRGGGIVLLSSDAPNIVSVPDSVAIGSEEDAAIFPLTFAAEGTYPKGTVKNVTIRAKHAGVTREAIVKVIF